MRGDENSPRLGDRRLLQRIVRDVQRARGSSTPCAPAMMLEAPEEVQQRHRHAVDADRHAVLEGDVDRRGLAGFQGDGARRRRAIAEAAVFDRQRHVALPGVGELLSSVMPHSPAGASTVIVGSSARIVRSSGDALPAGSPWATIVACSMLAISTSFCAISGCASDAETGDRVAEDPGLEGADEIVAGERVADVDHVRAQRRRWRARGRGSPRALPCPARDPW